MGLFVAIPALVLLFLLSAFFSASETVLFSLTPLQRKRLAERNPAVGATVGRWVDSPARVLSAILAGNTVVNFAVGSLGYLTLSSVAPAVAGALSVPLFTLLLLCFGEIFPKQYAMRRAERLAPAVVRMLTVMNVLLAPLSRLMTASTKVFGGLLERERRALSDDEFLAVVDVAESTGELDAEEAGMVEGVMRLTDLYAVNEMTPRVRLEALPASMPDSEKVARALASPHRYLPVYEGDRDHITGILDSRKLFLLPDRSVSLATEPPLRVKDRDGLDDILLAFIRTGRRVAVVEDRWGGTAGFITAGDILELLTDPDEGRGA